MATGATGRPAGWGSDVNGDWDLAIKEDATRAAAKKPIVWIPSNWKPGCLVAGGVAAAMLVAAMGINALYGSRRENGAREYIPRIDGYHPAQHALTEFKEREKVTPGFVIVKGQDGKETKVPVERDYLATAEQNLQKILSDAKPYAVPTARGDVVVFYFHGNARQMLNKAYETLFGHNNDIGSLDDNRRYFAFLRATDAIGTNNGALGTKDGDEDGCIFEEDVKLMLNRTRPDLDTLLDIYVQKEQDYLPAKQAYRPSRR
jgi:hypothetical protein